MEYVVFTTKHVDGFYNWDSAYTDFKITNTPFGRDVLKELSEACQRRAIPLCVYYSIPDMHHPNYPHAGRPYEYESSPEGCEADLGKYLEFMRNQARELLTNYGPIHDWWWDGNVMEHADEAANRIIAWQQMWDFRENMNTDPSELFPKGFPHYNWGSAAYCYLAERLYRV